MDTEPSSIVNADAEKVRCHSSLRKRVLSGFILGPVTIALVLLGSWFFLGFVVIAGIISLYECFNMAKTDNQPTKFMIIGGLYITFCLSAYVFLRFGFDQGGWLALSVMLAVWASDTGAYATGRMIGGPKLCPKISPNKTWAGFGGALFFSGLMLMIMAGTGRFFEPWIRTDIGLKPQHVWAVFFVGCFLGAVGQAGDLLISWFKRRAGLKDTGDLIPGHGGLLDRIDSLLLVAPVFLLIMMAWGGMKTVSILGSTGSVGRSTVDLLLSQPGSFDVQALTCNSNVELLAEQAKKLNCKKAVAADPQAYSELKERLAGTNIEAAAGPASVLEAAAMPADWIMAAIVGVAGLEPIMAAIAQGNCVAIANKEPLVAAGPFVLAAAKKSGATLLPVDSEHNAIFQVFDRDRPAGIKKIILTASGGPFLDWPLEKIAQATPAQAVAHPNWSMGAKISVDSASMMNKALEVIEAHYLFNMPAEKIDVLIHPQSIIHSMVQYSDGSVLAQMGAPDMRTPIAHALAWPDRMNTTGRRLDLSRAMTLDFRPLDKVKFSAIELAYDCLRAGPGACVAFNAANEVAVAAFLDGQIGFLQIVEIVRDIVAETANPSLPVLNDILLCDKAVRERTKSHIIKQRRTLHISGGAS